MRIYQSCYTLHYMTVPHNGHDALRNAISAAHRDYLDSITPKKRLPREFLNGIVHGLGIAIGSTIIFALAAYLFSKLLLIPQIDTVVEEIKQASPQAQH